MLFPQVPLKRKTNGVFIFVHTVLLVILPKERIPDQKQELGCLYLSNMWITWHISIFLYPLPPWLGSLNVGRGLWGPLLWKQLSQFFSSSLASLSSFEAPSCSWQGPGIPNSIFSQTVPVSCLDGVFLHRKNKNLTSWHSCSQLPVCLHPCHVGSGRDPENMGRHSINRRWKHLGCHPWRVTMQWDQILVRLLFRWFTLDECTFKFWNCFLQVMFPELTSCYTIKFLKKTFFGTQSALSFLHQLRLRPGENTVSR